MSRLISSEIVLLESRAARDGQLAAMPQERASQILEKVKGLFFALWQGTGLATSEQTAEYYEVTTDVVRDNIRRHREEFESDGLKVLRGKALKDAREIISLPSDTSQATVWTPRAAMRLGYLLRDSEVAKQVRTASLDLIEKTIPAQNEQLRALELTNENLKMQLALVDRTNAMAIMHGIPTTLLLLGKGDHIEEVEKPTLEVIDARHNVRFEGQTTKQVAEYLNKKFGTRFKSGAEVARVLKRLKKDGLIAQTPRTVTGEYIPKEYLQEVYAALTSGTRQQLLGE